MKSVSLVLCVLFLSLNCSDQKENKANEENSITTKEVTYSAGEITLKGFLAYKEDTVGKKPGVIVVHEWWGNNDYSRRRAEMLADLGYIALAIDMYGDGKQAHNPDDAGKLAGETMSNIETAKARFDAGVNYLKQQAQTDSGKIAAVGYCFGGGVILNMVLLGDDLDGIISFHGSLPGTVPNPELVKAKILVCAGGDDPFVPQDQVNKFEQMMDSADIDYKLIIYPGASHAFTNPAADSVGKKFNMPIAYNKEADEKSWDEMKKFLNEIFKQ